MYIKYSFGFLVLNNRKVDRKGFFLNKELLNHVGQDTCRYVCWPAVRNKIQSKSSQFVIMFP